MTRMNRRHFLQAASATSLATLAGIPTISRAQSPVALRFSSSMTADENSAHYIWYQIFQKNLKEAVGDKIRLDYFPNNQLGKESDVVQQVKVGSIDMMVTGSSIWATLLPEIGMLDLGYLFDNDAQVGKVMSGPVGTTLSELLQNRAGCSILTWASHFGPRNVYTKSTIKSLAEVKGVKLRVFPTQAFIETFKIMGAIPTPIPFGELYMAVQTGVVDGYEHDAGTSVASKLYEVVKSCWMTEHLFSPMIVVMGKRAMDKIPADLRPAYMEAVKLTTTQQRVVAAQKAEAAIEELKAKGLTFFPMSTQDRSFVRKEMQDRLWSEFAKKYPVTAPLFDDINRARG